MTMTGESVTATAVPPKTDPPPQTNQPLAADAMPTIPDALTEALRDIGDASALRRFPRSVIESLGRQGVLRRRWEGGAPGDVRYGIALAEEASR
jgi:hypothetical protein